MTRQKKKKATSSCRVKVHEVCNHGLPQQVEGERVYKRFLRSFTGALRQQLSGKHPTGTIQVTSVDFALRSTFKICPGIWKCQEKINTLKAWFLATGAGYLLDTFRLNEKMPPELDPLSREVVTAHIVMLLENHDTSVDLDTHQFDGRAFHDLSAADVMRNKDIRDGCVRSTIKFYQKRVKCACVDELYKRARSMPKTGLCQQCIKRTPRKELLVCSRCKVQCYCSKKVRSISCAVSVVEITRQTPLAHLSPQCQAARLAKHKTFCDQYAGRFLFY